MKLRVAVVGLGIGQQHVKAYQSLPEQYDVVAVCSAHPDKARAVAATLNVPRAPADLAELCQMADLDVIDICTPSYLHYPQTCQALAAGKHVICEKPLAASLQEVDNLSRLEAQYGRRVMPIFQYRFGHGLQKLKLLVAKSVTGPSYLTTAEVAWRRRADYYDSPWRGKRQTELGGALTTHAIHALDSLLYVLGPARRVFASITTRVNPIQVEDCAVVSLQMADGSLASLTATLGSAAEISRHHFCFRHLSAASNSQPYTNTADPWSFTADSPEAAAQMAETLAHFVPQGQGFAGQFARFYQALQQGTELPVTLADARAAIELLTAIYHSAQTGQEVTLPIGPEHPRYAGWSL